MMRSMDLIDLPRLTRSLNMQRSVDLVKAARAQNTIEPGTTGYLTDVVFPRDNYTNMLLTIKSSEELGILDTEYIQDYDSIDGFFTLKRLSDGVRTSYPAVAVPDETPSVDNDVWRITVPLATITNGFYELEGRVRDLIGNHTIFGAVASPIGGERVTTLTLEVYAGFAREYIHQTGSVTVRPVLEVIRAERTAYVI